MVSALLNTAGLIHDHNLLSPEETKVLINFPYLFSSTQMLLQLTYSRRFTETVFQFLLIVFIIQMNPA